LEKNSPRGERADIVGRINAVSENDVVIQRSAPAILLGLRNAAQGRARAVGDMNARFERLLASGALERAAAEPDLAGSDAVARSVLLTNGTGAVGP